MSQELFAAKLESILCEMSAAGLVSTAYYAELFQLWQRFQLWNPLQAERDRIHDVIFTTLDGKGSTECNACGMLQKCYARPISYTTLHELLNLWQHTIVRPHPDILPGGFLATKYTRPSYLNGGGDFSKLRFWGMVEPLDPVGEGKKSNSGFWKILPFGVSWLTAPYYDQNPVYAWRRVFLYDNKFVAWDTKDPIQSTDVKCDKSKFDFDKLMRGVLGLKS